MSDYLVDLGGNPAARRFVKTLGLPLPLPQRLSRGRGALEERPVDGLSALVGRVGPVDAQVQDALAAALPALGANVALVGEGFEPQPWRAAGEAFGRNIAFLSKIGADETSSLLVVDASGARTTAHLQTLYEVTHPVVSGLRKCGRVVVLGRPPETLVVPEAVAVQRGLAGFVKSLAKEVGAKGVTVNHLEVASGAEERLTGPLGFLLSARSAFVTGQTISVDAVAHGPSAAYSRRPLEGKVALVTGAARGIGRATACRLAEEGARVFVLDRGDDAGPLGEVAREVGGVAIAVDITQEDAVQRIAETVGSRGLDIVVHNAGVTRDKTLARMAPDRWDIVMAVNLEAIVRLEAGFVAHDLLRQNGRTIVMSSVAGIAGNVGQTTYALTKAALVGYVSALAVERAHRGITVNAIAPGFIETRLTDAIPVATREAARRLSALAQGGLPIDIAEAVVFLASPCALGVTGRTLRVCGGNFIGA